MRVNIFQDAIESSAKVFGRKDVGIVFEGSEAKTDGDTIYLPSLPASAEINVEQADVIRGFRDHESMHVRCTDTSKASIQRLTEVTHSNAHHGNLMQYCEDVRIEHAGTSEYAGMKNSLSATNTYAAKMLLEQLESHGNPAEVISTLPPHSKLSFMLQAMGRQKIGITSGGIYDALVEGIKATDEKLWDMADKFSDRMVDLPTGYNKGKLVESTSRKGTAAAFDLAAEIFKALEAHEPPAPPPPPQQPQPDQAGNLKEKPKDAPPPCKQPKGDDESDEADGSDGDGADGDGEEGDEDDGTQGSGDSDSDDDGDGQGDGDESDDDGDSSSGSGDPDDGDGDDPSDSQGHGEGDPQSGDDNGNSNPQSPPSHGQHGITLDPDQFKLDDLYKNALDDVIKDLNDAAPIKLGGPKTKKFRVFSSKFSQSVPIADVVFAGIGASTANDQVYATNKANETMRMIDADLVGKKAMIRRLLELELQARSDRHWESGHKSGRLQSVRLVQAIQGRETVYQQRQHGSDMDTLLFISIDGSQSMTHNRRAIEAISLSYALSEALERTGCDIIVSMWGNKSVTEKQSKQAKYTEAALRKLMKDAECDKQGRMSTYNNDFVSAGLLTRGLIKAKNHRTTDPTTRTGFGLATQTLICSTPTYQAIFEDLKDMSRERHAKKIYLHITDGEPDDIGHVFNSSELMKEAHDYAAAAHVHMIGVGIAGMQVSHMFPDCIEVSGADAYEPVIKKLAKLVAKEAGHAAGFKRTA